MATNVVFQDLKANKSSPEQLARKFQSWPFSRSTVSSEYSKKDSSKSLRFLMPSMARQIFGAVNQKQLLYIRFSMHGTIWVTPWKINSSNLQITHLERKIIFQTSVIMFHVNLQGCSLATSRLILLWKIFTHIMDFLHDTIYYSTPTNWKIHSCFPTKKTFLLGSPASYLPHLPGPPIWKIGESQRSRQSLSRRKCR